MSSAIEEKKEFRRKSFGLDKKLIMKEDILLLLLSQIKIPIQMLEKQKILLMGFDLVHFHEQKFQIIAQKYRFHSRTNKQKMDTESSLLLGKVISL